MINVGASLIFVGEVSMISKVAGWIVRYAPGSGYCLGDGCGI